MVTVCPSQFATRRTLFHVLVYAWGPAAGGPDGAGAWGRLRLWVVGHRLDCGQDRLHSAVLVLVGAASRARPGYAGWADDGGAGADQGAEARGPRAAAGE